MICKLNASNSVIFGHGPITNYFLHCAK